MYGLLIQRGEDGAEAVHEDVLDGLFVKPKKH